MKVLLIWQIIPETTKFYFIPNATEDEINVLKIANNKIQNSSSLTQEEEKSLEKINNALCVKLEYCYSREGNDTDWFTKWSEFEIGLPLRTNEEILIVTCGFYI